MRVPPTRQQQRTSASPEDQTSKDARAPRCVRQPQHLDKLRPAFKLALRPLVVLVPRQTLCPACQASQASKEEGLCTQGTFLRWGLLGIGKATRGVTTDGMLEFTNKVFWSSRQCYSDGLLEWTSLARVRLKSTASYLEDSASYNSKRL